MERQLDYVLRTVEERGVRFVRLWFTDVLGLPEVASRSRPAELEVALEEGMTFDGSAIEGYSRVQESDMLAMPDPNTFEIVPWRGDDAAVARMFCDIQHLSGEPFDGDPRYVLKRNLERAREKGFTFFVGPEMEFFYFRVRRRAPSRSTTPASSTSPQHDIGERAAQADRSLTLEAMGIPVEYCFHENGPSQHEIDLRYTDALTMADNVMTFRLVVKEVAHDLGVYATFMPKPIAGAFGSGMHTHLSLFEGDVNAFHDPGDEYGLSKVGQALHRRAARARARDHRGHEPVGQLVQAARSPGYEAPVYMCWARNNRSALVRVPLPKRGKESSTRIEFRSPDPACNPYLAFSVMLAAGPQGHRGGLRPPARGHRTTSTRCTDEERARRRHRLAARSRSRDALDAMERSELVAEALGEHVFEYFLRNKRREWADYKAYVTPFELDRYLGTL